MYRYCLAHLALLPFMIACAQGGFGTGMDAGVGSQTDASRATRDARMPQPDSGFPDATAVALDGEVLEPDACIVSREVCNRRDDDCDGMTDEDPGGDLCSFANATGVCTDGTCTLGPCLTGFDDCDDDPTNGCEGDFAHTMTCGSCTNACDPGEACIGGRCEATECEPGESDCDGNPANGCEVDHRIAENTCATAIDFGTGCGDYACGFGCFSSNWVLQGTHRGVGTAWFHVAVDECSTCAASTGAGIELIVPPGIDFDYCVYVSCSSAPLFCATAGTGVDEWEQIGRSERSGVEDGFEFWIEVYGYSGTSCDPWELNVYTTSCT